MAEIKINDSDNYESIMVWVDRDKFPIIWRKRVESFLAIGMTQEEAEKLSTGNIELELYFDVDAGLFGIESEAIESGGIRNPYSGEYLIENNN